MAFNSKPTESFSIVTGVASFNVIAVNPTREELDSMGISLKESVDNIDTRDGVDRIRLDFFIKNEKLGVHRFSLWIEKGNKTSSAGNNQYINDYGQTCWATSKDDAINKVSKNGNKWFKDSGVRLAYSGEDQLIEFIKSWLSVPIDGIAKIDNMEALFNGNVSEIKALIKEFSDLQVQVYMYCNDKNYQAIYTKHFERGNNKNMGRWVTYFNNLTTKFTKFVGTAIKEAVLNDGSYEEETSDDSANEWN